MKNILLITGILFCLLQIKSQDTFSICAIDTITGEVGSAGASCVYIANQGVRIISDVHPGVGVIHTQAYYLQANQVYARNLMNEGLSPQQIIDSLVANDAQNNPSRRQYGIVDFRGLAPRSEAYTGVNCDDYKNHITGRNYAIQGNILLGQHILDSMEARFLNAEGELACRLMEALQGAKVVGADTRCLSDGISSIGAFLRVAQPDDALNDLYLDLNIPIADPGVDPIDSLQVLIDNWAGCINTDLGHQLTNDDLRIYPNPAIELVTFEFKKPIDLLVLKIYNLKGILVKEIQSVNSHTIHWDVRKYPKGIYFYHALSNNERDVLTGKIAIK